MEPVPSPNSAGTEEDVIQARALWTIAPRLCEIRSEQLPPVGPDEARVRTLYSGISAGTESLVFAGKVPVSEYQTMRAPFQAGAFSYPVKYGYAAVGIVETGPGDWPGARVFVLHPHQDRFVVPVAALTRIRDDVPSPRAVLSANMETALNAVWDSGIGPGDRVAIVGAGVVGALVASIIGAIPGLELTIIDTDPARSERAGTFGTAFLLASEVNDALPRFDCVFHASGTPAGLTTALQIAGIEAGIIDLSWYGDQAVAVPLGQAFHSRRLRIISSQVGMISPGRRARFDHPRRMGIVQRLLADVRLDTLIGTETAFSDLPAKMRAILGNRSGTCPACHLSIKILRSAMFSVEVRDHIMIAHSFKGALFGPAQALHGATFVVDAAFCAPELTPEGVVVDIGKAIDVLKAILTPLNYRNLDDLDSFAGTNTTTEVLAKYIFDQLVLAIGTGALGAGADGITRLKITLGESHVAKASFEADLPR